MAKKKVKLTEDILRGIIRESVNEFIGFDGQGGMNEGETPWMDDHEADYHKNHARYGKHDDPFFLSNFEYDEALDADSPEEYDKLMRDRDDVLKTRGELAQDHHPQCTPFTDDSSSYATLRYPRDEYFDPDDKYNWPSMEAMHYHKDYFPQGELDEGMIRRIVRESLLEAENGGWVIDDSEAMEAYAFAEEKMGKETIDTAIIRAMSTHQLADILAYIFRVYDFREWDEYKSNKDSDIIQ